MAKPYDQIPDRRAIVRRRALEETLAALVEDLPTGGEPPRPAVLALLRDTLAEGRARHPHRRREPALRRARPDHPHRDSRGALPVGRPRAVRRADQGFYPEIPDRRWPRLRRGKARRARPAPPAHGRFALRRR